MNHPESHYDVEWDEAKNVANQRSTAFPLKKAATVFSDPLELMIDDPDHGFDERRFVSIGESFSQRLLIVSYTQRGDTIRVINAREPTRRERRGYEQ